MAQVRTVGRALIVLAATVVVLGGVRIAAPILSPLLLALFFATLAQPLYAWMRGRGLSPGLALGLLALVLVGIAASLGLIVWLSLAQLFGNLARYEELIDEHLAALGLPLSALTPGGSQLVGALATFAVSVSGLAANFFFVVMAILFLVADGPRLMGRLRAWLGSEHLLVAHLERFAPAMQQFFGMRSYLNAITGLGIGVGLWLLGIDFAALWGVVIFFLSYVPYIGLFVGAAPPVVIALAEYGLGRALAVIALVTVVNVFLENIAMPRMMGRGFSLSPFVVFAAFAFWTWLIGPAGALLAMALTQLLVLVLESFPETQGMAGLLKTDDPGRAGAVSDTSVSAIEPGQRA